MVQFIHTSVVLHRVCIDFVKFKVIHDPKLTYQHIHAIQWLSLQHAVEAVQKTLPSLVMNFEHEEAEGDPTAIGLTRELTGFVFVAMTHLLVDALGL